MSSAPPRRPAASTRSPIQVAALVVGVVFLVVGFAGFIPGITTDMRELELAGHESHAKLLGLFQVSILHNVVHLIFGIAGIVVAKSFFNARLYFVFGGAAYLLLVVYGFLVGKNSRYNFVPLNMADDYLHLLLGVVMLGVGIVLGRKAPGRR